MDCSVLVNPHVSRIARFEDRAEDQHEKGRISGGQRTDILAFLRIFFGDTMTPLPEEERIITPSEPVVRIFGNGGNVIG